MGWAQFLRDTATFATANNTYQANKKLETLNDSLEDFKHQTVAELSKLQETVEKGLSMLSFELAIQSSTFKNIFTVLKEKRKTEAEELKNFGIKALRNGWIKDAVEDFNKSIELNRYDYQVYYLLSKCHSLLDDKDKQNHCLQMAFQYSVDDSEFRQYIGLDIVGKLIKEKKFEEAKDVVLFLEKLLDKNSDLTPLLISKIYIDIFSESFSENTISLIDRAVDNYEGDEPSRIITVLTVLSNYVTDNKKQIIENRLNLKKLEIMKKYASHFLISIDNIEKILIFIYKNDDNHFLLKVTPEEVFSRYFPLYKSIPDIVDSIRAFKTRINKITISSYDTFRYLSQVVRQIENILIKNVKAIYEKYEDKSFNTSPFAQNLVPELQFNVGVDDKILAQCKLQNGELITLTYFKIIAIDSDKNKYECDLLDNLVNIECERLREEDVKLMDNDDKFYKKVVFSLKDKTNGKLLFLSSSNNYSKDYGKFDTIHKIDNYENVLNLIWSRAFFNINIYVNYKNLNSSIEAINSCLKVVNNKIDDNKNNSHNLIDESVEFVD
jgi:hypothetical protein